MLIWAVVAIHPNLERRTLASHADWSSAQNDAQKFQRFLGTRITVRIVKRSFDGDD